MAADHTPKGLAQSLTASPILFNRYQRKRAATRARAWHRFWGRIQAEQPAEVERSDDVKVEVLPGHTVVERRGG